MLKIGILTTDIQQLNNWELRIIHGIINDPSLELAVLIKEENKNILQKKAISKPFQILKKKNLLGRILFNTQIKIEERKYPEKITISRENVRKGLDSIPTITARFFDKETCDIFSRDTNKKIEDLRLDVIVKLGFSTIKGDILNIPNYGVWAFNYNYDSNSNPIGLREIILKKPNIGVSLQQLTPAPDETLTIDRTYYNKFNSFVVSNRIVKENSVSLLFKNFKKLQNGDFHLVKSKTGQNTSQYFPNAMDTLKYLFSFYGYIGNEVIKKIKIKLFKTRYDCWSLFVGEGNFLESNPSRLNPIKLPKGEFWADPFLFKYQKDVYVFFENYPYSQKKGKISCGRLVNNTIVDVRDVLDLDYHLSYPFIFEEDGEIYLMPESCENKRLELYKCIDFPQKWKLYSTAFEGEIVYDAHFYNDGNQQKWLFINKKEETESSDNQLYIYKVDSLKMDVIQEHKQNPVLVDSRLARNGGAVFEYQGDLYRPSQYNADGIYGRGLNINKITKLNINEYAEDKVFRAMPTFHKGIEGTHHLHQLNGIHIVDAVFTKKSST